MYRACRGAVSLGGSAVRFGDPSLRPVPSSRSAARSIFLVSTDGRRYAVFVSSFSCVIRWRRERVVFPYSLRSFVRSFVSSLVSRVRLVGRLVVILCGSLVGSSRLAHRFARRPVASSRPAVGLSSFVPRLLGLACRSLWFCLARLIVSRLASLGRLVKQSVCSLFAWRLVSAVRGVG